VNDFTNPAKRILNIANQAVGMPDKLSIGEVWGRVLGVDEKALNEEFHLLYQKLGMVRSELDLLQELMKETHLSSELYEPYIIRIKSIVTVKNLEAAWGNFKNKLQSDTILALKYCSDILPSEPNIDQNELEKILSIINDIRLELESSSLSIGMYKFLISQLSIMENAIQSYPISGGTVFKKAFSDGFADLVAHADDISKATDVELKTSTKVFGVWSSLKVAGEEFVKADRIANAFIGLISKGHAIAGAVLGLLT